MGIKFVAILSLLLSAASSSSLAGLTVTSYSTVALTNAFSPVGSGQYFSRQTLTNVSPATASVSGDWMGPTAGGSTDTWHFVGVSQVTSTTTSDVNILTVTAVGSFAYELNTTAEFVDPRSSSVFTPSGAANYEGLFEIDAVAAYSITAQLNPRGRVRLNTLQGQVIFDHSNHTATPVFVDLSGALAAGQYRVLATTGLAAPNFPNGVNQFTSSGSYENLTFTVQVPEPGGLGLIAAFAAVINMRRRRT